MLLDQRESPRDRQRELAFYAATIDGPDTIHEQLPASAFNGRMRHEVKTNPITIVFPKIRPIAVTVVGDDTGEPIAGARVGTLGDSLATGIVSYGTTDAAGKVLLGLPPGRYKGIVLRPSDRDPLHPHLSASTGGGAWGRCPALRDPSKGRSRIDSAGGRDPARQSDRRRLLLESPRRSARGDTTDRDVDVPFGPALD